MSVIYCEYGHHYVDEDQHTLTTIGRAEVCDTCLESPDFGYCVACDHFYRDPPRLCPVCGNTLL